MLNVTETDYRFLLDPVADPATEPGHRSQPPHWSGPIGERVPTYAANTIDDKVTVLAKRKAELLPA